MLDRPCHIVFQSWATQKVQHMGPLVRLLSVEPQQVISSQASVSSSTQMGIIELLTWWGC